MSDIAIRVENLSKMYRIGLGRQRHDTLRDAVVDGLRRAFRRDGRRREEEIIWALKDVSFEVKRGEVLGIIGRNGAGKSTLLKILSRITEPTSGRAEIYGRVGSLLEVGTGFHPELTGRENIYLSGAVLGMKKAEIDRRFDEIVEFAEISKFLDTPVKRYSSGMYVRLAFAVAAHLEPEILLVDEVLAVGDMGFQKKCLGKMGDVAGQGRTVLFVSHNMGAISKLCSEAILFDVGKLIAKGATQRVVTEYSSMFQSITPGVVSLENDDGKVAVVREVSIINSRGSPSTLLRGDEQFWICVEFSITRVVSMAQVAVAVLTKEGMPVFVTTHVDNMPGHQSTLSPGYYKASVKVPGSFLNVGEYAVNVRIFGRVESSVRRSLADAWYVLQFALTESGSLRNRIGDRRTGVVTPVLDWQMSQVTG